MTPSDLDLARDYRRFWWLLPPAGMAIVIFAVIQAVNFLQADRPVVLTEQVSNRIDTGPAPLVIVESFGGNVRVAGGSNGRVWATVVRRGSGRTEPEAFNDLARLEVQMYAEGNTVRIRAARPSITNRPEGNARPSIDLTVPPGARLQIETDNGFIFVSGVQGDIFAVTPHGDITVRWPEDTPFLLDGSGHLQSEFVDHRMFQLLPPGTPAVPALILHAPTGLVSLERLR